MERSNAIFEKRYIIELRNCKRILFVVKCWRCQRNIPLDFLKKNDVFVDGGDVHNEVINPPITSKKRIVVLSVLDGDLSMKDGHIKDPTKGLHLLMKTTSTITIPPRKKCLESTDLLGRYVLQMIYVMRLMLFLQSVKIQNPSGKVKTHLF